MWDGIVWLPWKKRELKRWERGSLAPIRELTSQAEEMGGSQPMISAVLAGTEEDERLSLECGEGDGGFRAVLQWKPREQRAGEQDPGRGDSCVCSKVPTARHFGKESRTTGAVRVGTGSHGACWLEGHDLIHGNKGPTQPFKGFLVGWWCVG